MPPGIYCPLPVLTHRQEVEELLFSGSMEDFLILSLTLGEHFPDWKYAQDVCLRLAEHPSDKVRANACLGLAYIARTKQRLEKHLVLNLFFFKNFALRQSFAGGLKMRLDILTSI